MKRVSTILTLCLLTIFLYSKNEFSTDNTQWFIHDSWYSSFGGDWGKNFYHYRLDGDTLINNQTCKKLFLDNTYHGAILEEEKAIWYWYYDEATGETIKTLFYDFSKEKGDVIHFDYHIYLYDNLSLGIKKEAYDLTVLNVYHKYGRKIMELSNQDTWIEGMGSINGFWGIDLMLPTNGVSHSFYLHQVVADKQSIYMGGQLVNPDYVGTFLTEGKTWYIDKGNHFEQIKLESPTFDEYYSQYPVKGNGSDKNLGRLYDVNGTIYWDFHEIGMPLYNFNLSEGDKIRLYQSYFAHPVVNMPLKTEVYTVSKVDYIESEGKMFKRIFLDGSKPYIWIEGVGSTIGLIYMPYTLGNNTSVATTCCYVNDELIYHNTNYPDCETYPGSNLIDTPSLEPYTVDNNRLTISDCVGGLLNIYTINGKEIYSRSIQSTQEVIPLTTMPKSILLCKLIDKTGNTIIFKVNRQ